MDQNLEQLNQKIEALEKSLSQVVKVLDRTVTTIVENQKKIDQRFDNVDSQLSNLKGDSVHTIVTLESSLNDILVEIRKINAVTGYAEQHDNASKFGSIN